MTTLLYRLLGASILLAVTGCQRAPMPATATLGLPPLASAPAAPDAVALGRKLFMDTRLSRNGTMSCAMCHVPEQGFAAVELSTSVGLEGRSLRRNAPSLLNVAYVGQLFHDGRAASLEQQAWDPLLNEIEMGNTGSDDVLARLRSLPDYAGKFEAAYGGPADRARVGAALASYQRTLLAGDSRFDRWRYGGQADALSLSEQAGFAIFAGKGRCIACHTVGARAALFADGRFHNTGVGAAPRHDPQRSFQVQLAPGVWTTLRARDVASVSEPLQADAGRFEVTGAARDRWAYRTPSLRNVAITGPYMHDGSIATLEEVIDFYQRGGIDNGAKDALLQRLELNEQDKRDLVAFLRSLTSAHAGALAAQTRAAPELAP
ncbi:cytochrome-c peroxidase [Massilia sp. CF038]|uniref:cytochrome-c peroxidase n=1 Tax=Massilia sp. CF038 TaxID=1881045 RepID=UPI000922952E|nr:cytochrome c peroxidase [Massilia sp. CF038]SHH51508.1 cytochrome c peroxidase [Massilia sp. CF038]